MQNFVKAITRPVTATPATVVPAGTIIGCTTGTYAAAGAKATNFAGVTVENSDTNGYAGIATENEVDVIAGSAITEGQYLTSNASGQAIPYVYNSAGALTMVIGQARAAQATAGSLVRMKIMFFQGLS